MRLAAKELVAALGVELSGISNVIISSADSIQDASDESATWVGSLTPKTRKVLDNLSGAFIVVPEPSSASHRRFLNRLGSRNALAIVREPRLVFARILKRFFSDLELQLPKGVSQLACVSPSAQIGVDVTIAPFCFIGADVTIGDESVLHPGVAIHSHSVVGKRCLFKSNAVVGNRGFGFVKTADGCWEHFPQIGIVLIEDDVEIGAGTVVDRPGLGTTRLLRGTKVDNLCHIGHNAQVGPHAIVTACTEIGAGVVVGKGAWLGPNSCSIEGISLGEQSFVGIGSTVLHDVPAEKVVAGSPARPIEELRKRHRERC